MKSKTSKQRTCRRSLNRLDRRNDVCMDIDSPPGTRVRYKYPKDGTDGDIRRAKQYLSRHRIYTVERTEAHSFNTDVWLREVPGVIFNSVQFAPISDNSEALTANCYRR